jgi:uncharacterized peroxidase-related enzyme
MQRIKPVDPAEASEQVKELWAGVEELLGRVPNCFYVLAHTPDVATWLLTFCATLHRGGTGSVTDVKLKNLVALETSITNECTYCTSHNRSFGQGLGLSDDQITALEEDTYATVGLFDEREQAVIRWAKAVTENTAKYDKEAFEELRRHCTDAQIVELTLMGGLFALFNRLNDSLFIDLDSAAETDKIRRTTHLPRRKIHEFARRAAVEAGSPLAVATALGGA